MFVNMQQNVIAVCMIVVSPLIHRTEQALLEATAPELIEACEKRYKWWCESDEYCGGMRGSCKPQGCTGFVCKCKPGCVQDTQCESDFHCGGVKNACRQYDTTWRDGRLEGTYYKLCYCNTVCANDFGDTLCAQYGARGYCAPQSKYYNMMIRSCTKQCQLCVGDP